MLASVGDGSQEWGVGFDEEAVGGGCGCGFADGGGFGVGEVAGEGEVEASGDGFLGLGGGAGEAVHDAAEAGGGPVLVDEGEEIVEGGVGIAVLLELGFGLRGGQLGGAAVDEDGFAGDGSDLHLGDEGGLLDVGVGVVEVVVVEAYLAYGDAERVGGEAGEAFEGLWGGAGGLLGVDADAGVDAGVAVGDVEGTVHVVGTFADTYGEDGFDAGGLGACEDGVEVLGVEVEMGVRID